MGPLLQKEACRAFQQGQRHRLQSAGLGRCFAWQLQCSARSTGGAQVGKRAFFAQGRTVRHADQCSQLHKGLIVVAGRIRRLVLHHAGGERFFTAGSVTTAGSLYRRENTRNTFPSTAGTGMLKLMEAMAPAV